MSKVSPVTRETWIRGVVSFRALYPFSNWLLLTCFCSGIVLILTAIGLGYQSSYDRLLLLLLFSAVGGAIVLLLLQTPSLGPILFAAVCLMVPFGLRTGTQTILNASVLAAGVLIVICAFNIFLRRRPTRISWSRPMLPAALFACCSVVCFLINEFASVGTNQAPLPAQLAGLSIMILSVGLFLCMPQTISHSVWLKRLTWLYLGIGSVYIAARLVPASWVSISVLPAGADGSVFWIWIVCLAFSQAALNSDLHLGTRWMLGILVLASFYVAVAQSGSWASGWLPPLVGVFAILWFSRRRLALSVAAVAGILGLINIGRLWEAVMVNEQYSWVTRLEAWKIILKMTMVSPLLGFGPANYRFYTHLYPILGWNVDFNAHNNYVDILAQMGLVGLVLFGWLCLSTLRLGLRLAKTTAPGFARAYTFGALGGLSGMLASGMLADWILPFVYNIGLSGFRASACGWLFLGGLLVIEKLQRDGGQQGLAEQGHVLVPQSNR